MTEEEAAPKHPYVTAANAKFHLIMSIIAAVLSTIQVILGIIDSEKVVENTVNYDIAEEKSYYYYYDYTTSQKSLLGDTMWVAAVGYMMAALGFSVYRTRSRPNGVILATMTLITGFCAYPIAIGLCAGFNTDLKYGLANVRYVITVHLVLQLIFMLVWGFYASCHTCCNANVRTSRQLQQTSAQVAMPQAQVIPQAQMVFVQQPPQQYPAQQQQYPPMYTPGSVQVAPVPVSVAHIPADSPPTYSG